MNSNPRSPQITDTDVAGTDLDCAFLADREAILPSSGFADSVMAAVHREAVLPAPIPFPWMRALPGFAAVIVAAVFLIIASVALLRSAPGEHAGSLSIGLQAIPEPILHHGSQALWLAVSLAISVASLLFCRRLISSN
jgi:hypothetical protein